MMPLEVAMKLASASANCQKHKCPYASQCKGDYTTCAMKEIALILRSQNAEIDTLTAAIKGMRVLMEGANEYIKELEKINKRYHDLVLAFQQGYRPKKNVRRVYKPRKKKDVTEMDGDERYAYQDPDAPKSSTKAVVI